MFANWISHDIVRHVLLASLQVPVHIRTSDYCSTSCNSNLAWVFFATSSVLQYSTMGSTSNHCDTMIPCSSTEIATSTDHRADRYRASPPCVTVQSWNIIYSLHNLLTCKPLMITKFGQFNMSRVIIVWAASQTMYATSQTVKISTCPHLSSGHDSAVCLTTFT